MRDGGKLGCVVDTPAPLIVDDDRSGEVVLLHRPTGTAIVSDLLYKSAPAVVGPGGGTAQYTLPDWFSRGQEELFYGHADDASGGLLPSYRTHPRMRALDIPGARRSLDALLAWDVRAALACHCDPMEGEEFKRLIKTAWAWLWAEDTWGDQEGALPVEGETMAAAGAAATSGAAATAAVASGPSRSSTTLKAIPRQPATLLAVDEQKH